MLGISERLYPRSKLGPHGGFTLIELMIVIAVIAILLSLAIPAYSRYADRARRAEGQSLLMRIANKQEQYYTTHNAYTNDLANLDFSGTVTSDHDYYKAGVAWGATSDDQSYKVTVTPQNVQAGDKCGKLSLTNTGKKAFTGDESNGRCWDG